MAEIKEPRPPWPADNVERRPLDELIPYARNSRTHSDTQVAQIAASMREWGWTNPVLVDDEGGIIAGHGRVLAARKLGIKEAPVMIATGWTEAQKRAYVLADNQLALNAGWDTAMLQVELQDLAGMDFDLDLIGFAPDELEGILDGAEEGEGESGENPAAAGSLADRFMLPPFSVLNAREGWWQDRKRAWLALGIRSELGRGAPIGGGSDAVGSGGQALAVVPGQRVTTAKAERGATGLERL